MSGGGGTSSGSWGEHTIPSGLSIDLYGWMTIFCYGLVVVTLLVIWLLWRKSEGSGHKQTIIKRRRSVK